MPNYKVQRDRVYWVRETMNIEASDEDHAEEVFYSAFSPHLEVVEVYRAGIDTVYTPVTVTKESDGE
jgi:hypothetical protein